MYGGTGNPSSTLSSTENPESLFNGGPNDPRYQGLNRAQRRKAIAKEERSKRKAEKWLKRKNG